MYSTFPVVRSMLHYILSKKKINNNNTTLFFFEACHVGNINPVHVCTVPCTFIMYDSVIL